MVGKSKTADFFLMFAQQIISPLRLKSARILYGSQQTAEQARLYIIHSFTA